MTFQSGILAPVPAHARYLSASRRPGTTATQARTALRTLAPLLDGTQVVCGFSAPFAAALGARIAGLQPFPAFSEAKVDLPVTQSDLWLWLRHTDAGEVFHLSRKVVAALGAHFVLDQSMDSFTHHKSKDLSGFEDGTENPKGQKAMRAAFNSEGASFVAVQQWEHNFALLDVMKNAAKSRMIGRDLASNQEQETAPAAAHVKRTAQEEFTPEAFSLRRSMPWVAGPRGGLMFVSFGHSPAAFAAQLKRMCGAEDGIVDHLFALSRPLTGACYWCPPMAGRQADLARLTGG